MWVSKNVFIDTKFSIGCWLVWIAHIQYLVHWCPCIIHNLPWAST